jgi:CheY-like chemotaxis protein
MLVRPGELQVSVKDTGIGIPLDKQRTIFTMFGKLDSGSLNPQGCGLGLNISSMLVEKLGGGAIQVTSTPQSGSTFSFKVPIPSELPRKESSMEGLVIPSELIEIPKEQQCVPSSNCRNSSLKAQVLIVDDAPFNRLVLRKILKAANYSYSEASTGLEAVRMVRAALDKGSPFSVVLMDIEMPEMDGITATRELGRLVAQGRLPSLPVIIGCSAYCMEEDRANARAAGMTDYIEKPISRQRLFELIRLYYH